MQNFLYKIDKDDEKPLDDPFEVSQSSLEECLEYLNKGADFVKTNYKCHPANREFEDTEWHLKDFDNKNIKIEGNKHISFHKNYALLVFYGLIQFRNYQANNFNILFLAFSCNVLKKHFTTLGEKHIDKVVDLVKRNFDQKDKSDEYEMFLGKSGKNKLEGKEDYIDYYKNFSEIIIKNHYLKDIFEADNFDNFMTTSVEYLEGNQPKVLTNLSYLKLNGEIAR